MQLGLYLSRRFSSFTLIYHLETSWKLAAFQRRAFTLICAITAQPSLFPASYPHWVVPHPLQSAYSSPLREEPIGFTVFRVSDLRLT